MDKKSLVVPTPKGALKEILRITAEEAVDNKCNIIFLEPTIFHSIYYCIFELNEDTLSGSGAEITYSILSKLDGNNKKELCVELKNLAQLTLDNNTTADEFIAKDKILFGPDMINLFGRLAEIKEKDIFINLNPLEEVTVDDIIYGTIYDSDSTDLVKILKSAGINPEAYFVNFMSKAIGGILLNGVLNNDWKNNENNNIKGINPLNSAEFEEAGKTKDLHTKRVDPTSSTPVLDEFGIDMTDCAKQEKYDDVIGREKEVSQLIQILCCRKKNNAIVIGKAGTGKTALVEYLAQLISKGEVPDELKEKRVISISTTTLTAGTKYRGELEQRVQDICEEVAKNKNIIIFIDEFHSAVSSQSDDISQMLKPSLSRGELTLIAGTTDEEYKKYIEKDSALKRRFQKLFIEEPSKEDTLKILMGLRERYSNYHNVSYPDKILKMCVDLSTRYLYDRNSPDRAIDLMDISGSHAKLEHPTDTKKLDSLEKKILKIKKKKTELVKKECYSEASEERNKQLVLEKELDDLRISLKDGNEVTENDVATVISKLVNIPIDKILSPDIDKLRDMAPRLKTVIIGQDDSIDQVTKLLSRQFLGLRDENIPPSLYISGGTGTGKTYLAEQIAKTIFGSEDSMLRIDCGELTQPHTVTKLIGAPPSYVGFGEVALFDSVRERPQRLILVDEADKLCDEILNTIFLNILTTGFITLSNGIEVSFKDCIFIFTSNDGTRELEAHGSGIGFKMEDKETVTKEIVMKAIKKRIRPEVINRFSGIIVFNNLGKAEMEKIYELELKKVKDRLNKKGFSLTVDTEVRDKIIDELDLRYGARDLTRGIEKWVSDPICNELLNHDSAKKSKIKVGFSKKTNEVNVKLTK